MPATAIANLAVIDDSRDNRQILMAIAREAGYTPIEVAVPLPLDDLIALVMERADAAVTDLRLSEAWPVSYNGADVGFRLYSAKVPTIVVSEYANDDADTVIRAQRKYLPEVLRADAVNSPDELRTPLNECSEELKGRVPRHRRAWRALVRVTARYNVRNEPLLEVVIPEWDPHRPVRLPAHLVPNPLRDRLTTESRFFSHINTDARNSEEIFFDGFEDAPGSVS